MRPDQRSRAVSQPEPGFFAIRLVRKGPRVPARICHEKGCWHAVVNGEPLAAHADPGAAPMVFRIWHGGDFITEAEYERMLQVVRHAQQHRPDHPAASPTRPIDLAKIKQFF